MKRDERFLMESLEEAAPWSGGSSDHTRACRQLGARQDTTRLWRRKGADPKNKQLSSNPSFLFLTLTIPRTRPRSQVTKRRAVVRSVYAGVGSYAAGTGPTLRCLTVSPSSTVSSSSLFRGQPSCRTTR